MKKSCYFIKLILYVFSFQVQTGQPNLNGMKHEYIRRLKLFIESFQAYFQTDNDNENVCKFVCKVHIHQCVFSLLFFGVNVLYVFPYLVHLQLFHPHFSEVYVIPHHESYSTSFVKKNGKGCKLLWIQKPKKSFILLDEQRIQKGRRKITKRKINLLNM